VNSVRISVLEDKIRDLERILKADEALLATVKSSDRRRTLLEEMVGLEHEIDRLRSAIENFNQCD
jgi:predicted  nucleic acid-binding Zn-ribbon protein